MRIDIRNCALRGESAITRIRDFSMRSTIARSVSPMRVRSRSIDFSFCYLLFQRGSADEATALEKARRFNHTVSPNGEIRRSRSASSIRYTRSVNAPLRGRSRLIKRHVNDRGRRTRNSFRILASRFPCCANIAPRFSSFYSTYFLTRTRDRLSADLRYASQSQAF